jgi:hypothetical protein
MFTDNSTGIKKWGCYNCVFGCADALNLFNHALEKPRNLQRNRFSMGFLTRRVSRAASEWFVVFWTWSLGLKRWSTSVPAAAKRPTFSRNSHVGTSGASSTTLGLRHMGSLRFAVQEIT